MCTDLNMQNSMVVFIFFIYLFRPEIPFFGKFESENQNCQFKLKFGTKTNLNMHNSVALFIFSVFDWKYPFMANFILEVEVWYLEFQICRNHKSFTFFRFWPDILFLGKIGPRNQNCQFKLKFGILTNWNMQNSLLMLTFSVFDRK